MAYDRFLASKIGQMYACTFAATGGTVRRYIFDAGKTEVLFVLLATQDVRLIQGGVDVLAVNAEHLLGQVTDGFLLKKNTYWPMVVTGPTDRYLSMLGDVVTGSLYATVMSDLNFLVNFDYVNAPW